MIARNLAPELERVAAWAPSVTVTGPRQSGKTTLCKAVFPEHPYRTLEDPDQRAYATEDPRAFLSQFPDGAVIDEVQRVPDLVSYLQGVIDAAPTPGRWILSGSRNLALHAAVSQSLAGRTAVHQLLPLSWDEIRRFPRHPASLDEALFSGGYPRIFNQNLNPSDWLRDYVATYLERDVRKISNVGDLTIFQRFVELCAGRTGQLLNYSSLADDCGISQPTAKAWFSVLEASFVTFHLPAFNVRQRKRLVKMPKLYFHDSGLAAWLLGIREPRQLSAHPLRGALFETWVVTEVLKHRIHRGEGRGLSFYRDRNGAELDLVVEEPADLTLIEAKSTATPSSRLFGGVRRVRRHVQDLRPRCNVAVVYGGDELQQRTDGRLIPWRMVRSAAPPRVEPLVRVFTEGQPVAAANVLALFPDKTWKSTRTDEQGRATLDLRTGHVPLTVFVAGDGFAPHVESEWTPEERALHIQLTTRPGGGARIFEDVTPRSEVTVIVDHTAVTINLVEGARRTLVPDVAGGRDPTVPGWAHRGRFFVRVVKVFDGAALLEYGLTDDQPNEP